MYKTEIVDVQGHKQTSPMEVLIFEPEGAGPHPGLVVAQHIPLAHSGLENDEWQIHVGERYAQAGYVVAMPFVFHWWAKDADIQIKRDEFRDDDAVADLRAAQQLLAALPCPWPCSQ